MARVRMGIVCRKAVDLVTDYLEDALPARDRARFEAHLADCPYCAENLRQMRITIDVVGQVEPDVLSPDVREQLAALHRRRRSG